jgi:hypothetical protein
MVLTLGRHAIATARQAARHVACHCRSPELRAARYKKGTCLTACDRNSRRDASENKQRSMLYVYISNIVLLSCRKSSHLKIVSSSCYDMQLSACCHLFLCMSGAHATLPPSRCRRVGQERLVWLAPRCPKTLIRDYVALNLALALELLALSRTTVGARSRGRPLAIAPRRIEGVRQWCSSSQLQTSM